jgi:hypothetical protein
MWARVVDAFREVRDPFAPSAHSPQGVLALHAQPPFVLLAVCRMLCGNPCCPFLHPAKDLQPVVSAPFVFPPASFLSPRPNALPRTSPLPSAPPFLRLMPLSPPRDAAPPSLHLVTPVQPPPSPLRSATPSRRSKSPSSSSPPTRTPATSPCQPPAQRSC